MDRDVFSNQYVSDAVREKAARSRQEVEDMISRALKCLHCNFTVAYAYPDSQGHLNIKCPKCRQISVMNFGYFFRGYVHKPNKLPDFCDDQPTPVSYNEYEVKKELIAKYIPEAPDYFWYKAALADALEWQNYSEYMSIIVTLAKIERILSH